jgi:type I restriction enzyme S subunit
MNWPKVRLKYVSRFAYGDSLPPSEERLAFGDEKFQAFGSNGTFTTSATANTRAPAIIIGRKGSYGKINWSPTECFATDTTFFVDSTTSKNDLRWLYYVLQTLQLDVGSNEAAVPGLSRETAYERVVFVPKLKEQRQVAAFLDAKLGRLDELMRMKEQQLALLAEKRQALISHAVTRGLNPKADTKPSEVAWLGEIPAHWETKKLKYLVRFAGGATPDKSNSAFWNGMIPWVSPKDMKVEEVTDTEDHITEAGLRNSATSLIAPGAVLIVVRSGILQHTIPVAINLVEVSLNQDLRALITNRLMDSRYLALVIRGSQDVLLTLWRKEGATVESLEYEFMSQCKLPLPPIAEQKQIVDWLTTRLERLKKVGARLQTQLDKLNEYRQSLITAAVTGQVAIPEEVA